MNFCGLSLNVNALTKEAELNPKLQSKINKHSVDFTAPEAD